MPFKSEAQRRFMYSQHPELAAEFEKATPKGADLPEHVKKMADGGTTAGNPAELDAPAKDASVSDFLLPYMLGPSMKSAAEGIPSALEDLGETGSISIGRAAPKMEEAAEDVAPKVEPFIKGIQKSPSGNEIKIWGVRGDPSEIAKLGYGSDPGSVPENILRAKGLLPEKINMVTKYSPNPYSDGGTVDNLKHDKSEAQKADDVDPVIPATPPVASTDSAKTFAEGGKVERSSLEHPVPNAMMARAMNEGGYPHVTFMENEPLSKVKEVTHLEGAPKGMTKPETETGEKNNPKHMAAGGMPHVSIPKPPHVQNMPEHIDRPMSGVKETEGALHLAEGGKTPHFLEGLKKGALHKQLGVSEDKNIPEKKLEKAANSEDETLRKRAQFAINAKKWHHADGGVIPHEEKLKQIYKAMGIKKYADGGDVDASQLPSPATAPNPNDPGFWDSMKAALAQVGRPFMAPGLAAPAAEAAATPGIAPAVNAALGTNLAGPEAQPAPPTAPMAAPVVPPVAPVLAAKTALALSTSPAPNVGGLFNQDTSKLTEGLNPEDRQALANQLQSQQHGLGSVIAQAVAGLGDALAAKGGKEQHSLQNIFSMEKAQRDEALANFDKARQDRVQKLALQTQMGQNSIQQLAAQDAYGTDEHLNTMLGAPPGTAHKDLPLYFQAKAAQVAQQEKDADLYLKSHAQAATDIVNATKNASVFNIKPSAAQIQASGSKLADQYFNRAKGNLLVKPSDGGPSQWIPAQNLAKAKQIDPNLSVQP